MRKLTIAVVILSALSSSGVFSQENPNTKDFEILIPEAPVKNSLYRSIDFIDGRNDKTNLGVVQVGPFNTQTDVVAQPPLDIQLKKGFQSMTDSTAKEGELLFLLSQLRFAERTRAASEAGFCYLKAGLYAKNEGQYRLVGKTDTLVQVKGFDVTKATLKGGSKLITDFIATNMVKVASGERAYLYRELAMMDSTQKRDIPLYNVTTFAEGLYYNYQSFSQQKPDKNIFVETKKDGRISRVKINGEEDKLVTVKSGEVYAIVYNGIPYFATSYGFYPGEKRKDDFYFKGKVKVTASFGDVMVAQMMFGALGAALVSSANSVFEMRIDHNNGELIRIREVGYE